MKIPACPVLPHNDTKARQIEDSETREETPGHERHDIRPVRDREAEGDSKLGVLVRIQYAAALNHRVSIGVVSYSERLI